MGGTGPAALGLLCLLVGAVLPGLAQEVSTNQSAEFGSEVPTAATISPPAVSTVLPESGSVVSEFSDLTPGGIDNDSIAVTAPPPSEGPPPTAVSEPTNETSVITEAPQETNSSEEVTTPSPAYEGPETRGVTGPILTQPPPTTHTPTASVTEDVRTGTPSIFTESPLLPSTSPTQSNAETSPGSSQPAATTFHAGGTSAATSSQVVTTTATTEPPATSLATQTTETPHRPEEQGDDPALLEVGDHKEKPSSHSGSSSNPLFVMIVSVFTIMVVMVVVGVGFHRYKKKNRRTDFRRLQDLPMDDMMEDTPLALYSY